MPSCTVAAWFSPVTDFQNFGSRIHEDTARPRRVSLTRTIVRIPVAQLPSEDAKPRLLALHPLQAEDKQQNGKRDGAISHDQYRSHADRREAHPLQVPWGHLQAYPVRVFIRVCKWRPLMREHVNSQAWSSIHRAGDDQYPVIMLRCLVCAHAHRICHYYF